MKNIKILLAIVAVANFSEAAWADPIVCEFHNPRNVFNVIYNHKGDVFSEAFSKEVFQVECQKLKSYETTTGNVSQTVLQEAKGTLSVEEIRELAFDGRLGFYHKATNVSHQMSPFTIQRSVGIRTTMVNKSRDGSEISTRTETELRGVPYEVSVHKYDFFNYANVRLEIYNGAYRQYSGSLGQLESLGYADIANDLGQVIGYEKNSKGWGIHSEWRTLHGINLQSLVIIPVGFQVDDSNFSWEEVAANLAD